MTFDRALIRAGTAVVLAASLAACSTSGNAPSGTRVGAAAPTGVEGTWIDAKGTGLSTFSKGSFKTVATDTGQTLSDGSYSMTGPNAVQINGTSLIRQSPISFNCLMVSLSQLNCTSSANQQFTLTRRV